MSSDTSETSAASAASRAEQAGGSWQPAAMRGCVCADCSPPSMVVTRLTSQWSMAPQSGRQSKPLPTASVHAATAESSSRPLCGRKPSRGTQLWCAPAGSGRSAAADGAGSGSEKSTGVGRQGRRAGRHQGVGVPFLHAGVAAGGRRTTDWRTSTTRVTRLRPHVSKTAVGESEGVGRERRRDGGC